MFDPEFIKILFLIIISLSFLVDEYLSFLNLKHNRKPLSEDLKDIYDEDKYQKSLAYNEETTKFSFLTGSLSFIAMFLLIYFEGFGVIDNWLSRYFTNEITRALGFFGVLFLASDLLTIPFQWYSVFKLEARYGFNKMSLGTFVTDKIKSYSLTFIIGGFLVGLFFFLIMMLGQSFWWIFWIIASAFMLLMNLFYTSLILPLFNKLKPLEDGELKKAIEAYAQKVSFPLNNIFVIDGSKRSTKSNAFFSGLGKKKKIVLYDTLIENHSTEELVAVLAHEVGHFKKKHITISLVISLLQTGLILFILSRFIFSTEISFALGAAKTSFHLNVLAFGILFSPISSVLGIFMNILSRKNEYEADEFATRTFKGKELMNALKKLSKDNLSNLMPHPLYVFLNYSHPPLKARLSSINRIDSKLNI
jgi:STE24 endopeptidase